MSHTSPRFIEQEFNETMNLLAVSASERSQFAIIKRFFDLYIDDFSKAESYLAQLLPETPIFSDPFLLAGLRPVEIEQFLDALIICKERRLTISVLNLEDLIEAYTDSLRVVYGWLGKIEHNEQALVTTQDLSKYSKIQKETSLLVPVVEKIGTTLVGRLRSCSVSILGEAKEDSLSATFGVVGAEISGFLEPVKKAVRALYTSSSSGKTRYWSASVQFKYTHAWHSGRSANLAISGLYYCELLKAEEKAEYFELNEAACVTGDITESGKVLSVDSTTLIHKVEAAFFSWAHVLVVPIGQITDALRIIETLNKEFPNRHLPVIGVGELKELFYDRRISTHVKTGVVAHTVKKLWKRKYSITSGIIILALSLIIGRLALGPIDKNPVAIKFAGNKMIAINSRGKEIIDFEVGTEIVNSAQINQYSLNNFAQLVDVNTDGINEIIWRGIAKNSRTYKLYAANIKGDTLWESSIRDKLIYKEHPYITSNRFMITRLTSEDLNMDGNKELIVIANHDLYFPSQLLIINPVNGKVIKQMLHPGHIYSVLFKNVDNDPEKEILIAGVNNYKQLGFMSMINLEDVQGQISTGKDYEADNISEAKVQFYTFFPKTLPVYNQSNPHALTQSDMIFEGHNGNVIVRVKEYFDERKFGEVNYEFDNNLNLINIASGSSYDIITRDLYETGKLSFIPDGKYLQRFRDSLLYWDGEKLVNTPTLVNEYNSVEVEDSELW